jgi:hypothetical protein
MTMPPAPPSLELNYETPQPGGNARLLVRLAGIFTLISAGIDLLHAAISIGMIVIMHFAMSAAAAAAAAPPPGGAPAVAPPAAGPPPPVAPFPMTAYYFLYGTPGALSLITMIVLVIGGTKLLRMRKHAWGWGLAMGIVNCCQAWMVMGCCLLYIGPLAAGIYTIVILCLPHVRGYVQQASNASAS